MALKRISLSHFVIVESLDLELQSGFNVLTGETGAGKSILVDALQLALGARADSAIVREGMQRAEIAAEFDCPTHLHAWLEDAGFEVNEDILVRRTIDNQGKSRSWINGSAATATQLRHIGQALIDIHGQHAWQSLARPDAIRSLLDAYAYIDTRELTEHWHNWRSHVAQVEQARQLQLTKQYEVERLQWQIQEVEQLAPAEHEWHTLHQQHQRMNNMHSLVDAAHTAAHHLTQGPANIDSALNTVIQTLDRHTHLEPIFSEWIEVLSSAAAQTSDIAHSLNAYLRKTEVDTSTLEALDQRLSQWIGLSKKYNCQPQDLPERLHSWRASLQAIQMATDLPALEAAAAHRLHTYQQHAHCVSGQRLAAAPALSHAITAAIQNLGMEGGVFEVLIQPNQAPNAHGSDSIEFLVAGHPGSKPRPIHKIASGGELSRIALAIAVETSALSTAQTLVFDEVDSGIGGAVADAVGRLMRQLGRNKQVLAVTHLPQVAAHANHHLLVSKKQSNNVTISQVHTIHNEHRTLEIARMLGAEQPSTTSLAHAHEMIAVAHHS